MPSWLDDVDDLVFSTDVAVPAEQHRVGGATTSSGGAAGPAGASGSTPATLTTSDAEASALRPDDPVDETAVEPIEAPVVTEQGALGEDVEDTDGSDTVGAAGPMDTHRSAQTDSVPLSMERNVKLMFGPGKTKQVREVPEQILDELYRLARGQLSRLDQLKLEKVAVSKLVTAFLAVKLGLRVKGNEIDDQTASLMTLYSALDPASEALEQRIEALTVQVKLQRKEQKADRLRARAVERGVAVLVAERIQPTLEVQGLARAAIARDSHELAEKLLRSEAAQLAKVDHHAAGVPAR